MCKLFRKKNPGYGNGENFKPSWGVIIGHSEKAKGATGQGTNEYDYGKKVAIDCYAPYATRDHGGVLGAVKGLEYAECNASLEFHCNAFNSKVTGAEILVLKSDDLSKRYAQLVLEHFHERFPLNKIRGIKELSRGDRGYNNLKTAKKRMDAAILSEFFFIDSEFIDPILMSEFLNEVLV